MAIPVVVWVFARLARERLDRAVRAEREAMAARARAREEELAQTAAPATAQALDVVLGAGRAALTDLQRMLRVLRENPAEGDDVEEQPGTLAGVEGLVESAAATGRDVTLAVDGRERPLPAAVEATAYRVVQESLTNALKHAPGARVRVRVHHGDEALVVVVVDDGPGRGERGAGFGLAGIRERVALFDGRVSAGPRGDGPGWRTRVELPVPVREPAPA
jgi:signal transduction histidine kinase